MENLVSPESITLHLENVRKIVLHKRERLLNIYFNQITTSLLQLIKDDSTSVNDLFLEFLIYLSYALYLKSKFLLNEKMEGDSLKEEPLKDVYVRERGYHYYKTFLTERFLDENVFLPKINTSDINNNDHMKGDLNSLISAFISFLDRERNKARFSYNGEVKSIEEYINEVRMILKMKKLVLWEEIINLREDLNLLDKIYYFLSILFLVYEGECGFHQDEKGSIQIFIKV